MIVKRERITQQRAWTHVATSPLARVAVALLLLLSNSLTALALNEGPWTYESRRIGSCNINGNNTLSYWGFNNSVGWSVSITQYQNSGGKSGTGFTVTGSSVATDKLGIFSIFYHTENVPSYTRKVLMQYYKVHMNNTAHWNTLGLYARDDLSATVLDILLLSYR